ncbi:hypothetical protein CspHIS471_0206450 [Cutaneotrichosporon sp. HIS471]|nr:hypothetical protein CspHIS471_0206450 [Cutaneotrichosporon sp. HIS471]
MATKKDSGTRAGSAQVATAKTGGSTGKIGSGTDNSGSSSGGTKVGAKGPSRTTSRLVGKKTVTECFDVDGWRVSCKSGKSSKKTGIIVGSVIGAIVVIIVAIVVWKKLKDKKARKAKGDEEVAEAQAEDKAGDVETPPVGPDSAAPGDGYQPSPNGYVPPTASYMPAPAFEANPTQNFHSEVPQTREMANTDYQPPAGESQSNAPPSSELNGLQAQPVIQGYQPNTENQTVQAPTTETYHPNTVYPSGFQPNAPAATSSEPIPNDIQPGAARLS